MRGAMPYSPHLLFFGVDTDNLTFTIYPYILHFTVTNLSFKHYIKTKINS